MDRAVFVDRRSAEQMTLSDAIRHYLDAVAPTDLPWKSSSSLK
ncbi:hypothetical protein [Magnetospirillum sp. 15-1]|nr:hypothetical protein [Magnetospirillum sp. 15-1]